MQCQSPEELIETVPAKAKSRSANLVKASPIHLAALDRAGARFW